MEKQIIKEWADVLDAEGLPAIKDPTRRAITAQLLENTEVFFKAEAQARGGFKGALNEANDVSNQTNGIDYVDPVLISLVRRTAPNLMAYDLVGVQPMNGPTGLIFAMRASYGAQKDGPFGKPGDARGTAFDVDTAGLTQQQQWAEAGYAPDEAFYNEANTTKSGTGTQTSNATAPNYSSYSVGAGMATGVAETLGRGQGGDAAWQEMSFTIEKASVEAKTRALKASYSFELAQDLKATHGLDAKTELANILSTEITAEINREVVNTLRKVAKLAAAEVEYSNGTILEDTNGVVRTTVGTFDLGKNSDGRWSAEKYKSLLVKINKEANAIAKDTRRGRGNFIVCSSDVASILDLTGKMVYAPGVDNNLTVDDTGNTFVGILQGRFKVYIDPYLGYDEVIVGYKGASQMDAGFFYCPYVPLQMTEVVNPETHQPNLGYKTRYGMVANPFTTMTRNGNAYYRKFKVSGL